jgi:heme-degrading monooxygenase HmoA
MILEVAPLQVRSGQAAEFEAAFLKAQRIISSMPGYLSHELQRCLERPNEYVLLVRWVSLEAHEVGFRQSAEYQSGSNFSTTSMSRFPSCPTMSQFKARSAANPSVKGTSCATAQAAPYVER